MDIKQAKAWTKTLKGLVSESDTYHKIRLDDKLSFRLELPNGDKVELELVHEPKAWIYNGIYFNQNIGCGCGLGVDVHLRIKE
jgi:predicted neuraminidase